MIAVLTYHAIDESGSPISVTTAQFAAHVRSLVQARIPIVSLEQLPAQQGPAVAMVFDDGFRSVLTHAKPLLDEAGAIATVFAVSAHVGADNRWAGRGDRAVPIAPLLSWDELGRLQQAGWSIGAHTQTHPRLSALSPDAAVQEVVGSADDIVRHLGMRPATFAYPYGSTSLAGIGAVRQHFQMGFTTVLREWQPWRDDRACVPRIDAYYLRHRQLHDFGSMRFRMRLRVRHVGRVARHLLARQ